MAVNCARSFVLHLQMFAGLICQVTSEQLRAVCLSRLSLSLIDATEISTPERRSQCATSSSLPLSNHITLSDRNRKCSYLRHTEQNALNTLKHQREDPGSMFSSVWETCLTLALIISTAITIFMITVPSPYSHFDTCEYAEDDFNDGDKTEAVRSGFDYYLNHKDDRGKLRIDTTIQVVVLGDIGRSPRMQYHALSIASNGGRVELVGYTDSEVHPDITSHRFVNVVPITPFPKLLRTDNNLLFLLAAPLKVLWQIISLYHAMGYRAKASKWMLVQNPPSIPTLAVAHFTCFFRRTRLVIDWHNFGYSILALRLGRQNPLVKLSKRYERYFAGGRTNHFAVTNAMARILKQEWGVEAIALHDRPPKYFQPLSPKQRTAFLHHLPETSKHAADIEHGAWRLVVSSTSWTADEDFWLLLDALVTYSTAVDSCKTLPKILAIITGKGPYKDFYISQIKALNRGKKLQNVVIKTAWLSPIDYASLLASADLGISLHTSSSGVDLPMKVVDMFGTGLPVLGWSKFEAWSELVREGENGCGFDSSERLSSLLEELFGSDGSKLQRLRQGALEESKRRWDDEWMPTAGKLFQLRS